MALSKTQQPRTHRKIAFRMAFFWNWIDLPGPVLVSPWEIKGVGGGACQRRDTELAAGNREVDRKLKSQTLSEYPTEGKIPTSY